MKKLITTVLALILVLSITSAAFAADAVNVKLTADKETIHAGETVTISIDVDKAVSNLNDFQFNVYFDDELLEMTSSTKGSAYAATVVGDAKNGCIPVSGIDTLGDPVAFTAGNVATITFTAKTDITEEKTAKFEVVVDSLTDYDTFEQNPSTVSNTSVVIEIAAHEHKWDDGEVTTEPTCENAGVKTFKCKVTGCKETTTEEIEKTGHSYDKGVVTTNPECEKEGVKTFTCGTCGDTYTEAVEKTGHSYDDGVVTTEPECEKEGVKTFTCGTCGDTYTEAVEKTGHSYDDGVVTTEPECEKEGVKTFTCGTCGDTYTEVVEKTGHSYDDGVVTTEPECEKEGVKTFTCGTCGDTYTEVVEKTGHSYDEGVVTKEPTEEEEGVKTFTCGACGDTYTEPVAKLEGGETPPAGGEGETGGTTQDPSGTPDTGDNNLMVVYVVAIGVCAIGIAVLLLKRKQLCK